LTSYPGIDFGEGFREGKCRPPSVPVANDKTNSSTAKPTTTSKQKTISFKQRIEELGKAVIVSSRKLNCGLVA